MSKKGFVDKWVLLLAIGLVALAAIAIGVSKMNLIEKFYGVLPNIGESPQYKNALTNQEKIAIEQKATTSDIQYPTVAIEYIQGRHDLFIFRWNPDIEKVQMLCSINRENLQGDWLVSPVLCEKLQNGDGVYSKEQSFVQSIMGSSDEKEMIRAVGVASTADKEIRVKFIKTRFLKIINKETDLYGSIASQTITIPGKEVSNSFIQLTPEQVEFGIYGAREWDDDSSYKEVLAQYSEKIPELYVLGERVEFAKLEEWKKSDEQDGLYIRMETIGGKNSMEINVFLGEEERVGYIQRLYIDNKEVRYLRMDSQEVDS